MDEILNSAQQRSLRTILRIFEEDLLTAQAWVDGKEQTGALFRRTLELSPEKNAVIQAALNQAFEALKKIACQFNITRQEESAAMLLAGRMNEDWANLIDAQANKLKGFGPVNPHLADILDPPILQLADSAYHLGRLFQQVSGSFRPDVEPGSEEE